MKVYIVYSLWEDEDGLASVPNMQVFADGDKAVAYANEIITDYKAHGYVGHEKNCADCFDALNAEIGIGVRTYVNADCDWDCVEIHITKKEI